MSDPADFSARSTATGHPRHFRDAGAMSVLHPIADMAADIDFCRSGPIPDSCTAADDVLTNLLEPISKSFEKDNEAGELDKAEEIVGVVFPANKDAALPLNPGEEALDEPAAHVAA